MQKAYMRFAGVWPLKEQLTPWDHLTTTEMINISLPDLHTEQTAKS